MAISMDSSLAQIDVMRWKMSRALRRATEGMMWSDMWFLHSFVSTWVGTFWCSFWLSCLGQTFRPCAQISPKRSASCPKCPARNSWATQPNTSLASAAWDSSFSVLVGHSNQSVSSWSWWSSSEANESHEWESSYSPTLSPTCSVRADFCVSD